MRFFKEAFIISFYFQDMVSLCSLGCSGTISIEQANLELK